MILAIVAFGICCTTLIACVWCICMDSGDHNSDSEREFLLEKTTFLANYNSSGSQDGVYEQSGGVLSCARKLTEDSLTNDITSEKSSSQTVFGLLLKSPSDLLLSSKDMKTSTHPTDTPERQQTSNLTVIFSKTPTREINDSKIDIEQAETEV